MKKKTLFIALVLLVLTSNAQEYKEYYDNGKLKTFGTKKNDKKTGEWKYYYNSGALRIVGKYKDGKDIGKRKYYHQNGTLRAIGNYENGKMTGLWKYYHNNGELNKIGEKENGENIGEWKHYNENGKLSSLKKENDKEAIARIINYYLDGTRSDNPNLLRKAFHPDATLKFIDKEGSYKMRTIQKFFSYFTNTKTRSFVSKIYYIDISGSAANVKLTTKYETYRYVDYMNILKTKKGWKIVSKISHQDFF
ncbi:nuclear transport factor 2 family protein [Tenacibaculum retecalamus]|uniref:nuclear transport factor 2 family protein n=1 Tax=Tenacibaculum retecalamus TaxID=3018315 RepID=UPI0023D94644|nr:nuclear transport factor 2 family protein [Tenacibaculum retecalamus]WBX71068.1 nuclear transport factor 2 family protein [Tenacibaculum retecalamus]